MAPEKTRKESPGLEVSQLEIGDTLITEHGEVILKALDKEWGETTVYNFNVTNTHDFWANGYLVHNVLKDLVGLVPQLIEKK